MFFSSFLLTAQSWNVQDLPAQEVGNCEFEIELEYSGGFNFFQTFDRVYIQFGINDNSNWIISEYEIPDQMGLQDANTIEITNNGKLFELFFFGGFDGPDIFWENLTNFNITLKITGGEPGESFDFDRYPTNRLRLSGTSNFLLPQTHQNVNFDVSSDGQFVFGYLQNWNLPCPYYTGMCSGILNADVSITDIATGSSCDAISDISSTGLFGCTLCGDGPYEICVEETCDEPCGIDAQDLLILKQIILGYYEGCGNYCYVGDVNGSGGVSALDILLLQNYLLGIPLSQPPADWCRWVPLSELSDLGQPFNCPLQAQGYDRKCFTKDDNSVFTLIRMNVGDINGSCSDCEYQFSDDEIADRSATMNETESFGLLLDPKPMETAVYASEEDIFYGLTLLLDWPSTEPYVHLTSQLPGLEYGMTPEGLRIMWFAEEGKSSKDFLSSNDPIFVFKNSELRTINLVNGIENGILTDEGIFQLSVNIEHDNSVSAELFKLTGSTVVPDISHEWKATVYDMNGRSLRQLPQGRATDLSAILPPGMYIIRAQDASQTQTRKVFVH